MSKGPMRKSRHILLIMAAALAFACKPTVPSQYIQPDELEDILYDYHLADAMAEEANNGEDAQYNKILFRQAVLKKHGITQAEFDSTLVYYTRHADRLHSIYDNLYNRFADEAKALGSTVGEANRFGNITSAGDTANVWNGEKALLLTANAPYNVAEYDIRTDTTYHTGDKMMLSFFCDFIFKDGIKDAVAMLAVHFKNDSIASQVIHMSSNSSYTLTVTDNDKLGIKAIRGFFYMPKGKGDNNAALRLLAISGIKLIRFHIQDKPVTAPKDSISSPRPDSARHSKTTGEPATLPALDQDAPQAPSENTDANDRAPQPDKPLKLQPMRRLTR